MDAFSRRSWPVALVAVLALAPATARAQIATLAPQFVLSHSSGNLPSVDPLLDPNTFFVVGAGQTNTLPLDVRGLAGYSGDVRFRVRCCSGNGSGENFVSSRTTVEVVPGRVTLVGGAKPSTYPMPPDFDPPYRAWYEVSQFARATLRVTTPQGLMRSDTGNFLAEIEGTDGVLTTSTYVVFSVVDVRPDNTTPGCPSLPYFLGTPEVLPLETITRDFFALKAANPLKSSYTLGVVSRSGRQGWEITIDKPTRPLGSDQIELILNNPTRDGKSLFTYTSNDCSMGATGNIVLNPGETGELLVTKDSASTIVLSDFSHTYAVFGEPNFWQLFGGRRVTIDVVQ